MSISQQLDYCAPVLQHISDLGTITKKDNQFGRGKYYPHVDSL